MKNEIERISEIISEYSSGLQIVKQDSTPKYMDCTEYDITKIVQEYSIRKERKEERIQI